MMASVELPYLKKFISKGKHYAYYRRANKLIALAGVIGSIQFLESYRTIHESMEAEKPIHLGRGAPIAGSLRALIEAYKASGEYKQMKKASQAGYLWVLEWLLPSYGNSQVAKMPRDWVIRRRDELAETPGKANYFVTVMSVLLTWGIDRGFCLTNVAAKIKRLKTGESFRAWTDAEVEIFTSEAAGHMALPILIGLYTAQRRADVIKMPWSAYDGRTITLKQSKAGEKASVMVIPVHPVLKTALDTAPRTAITICARGDGHSWKKDHFAHAYAETRKKLGLAADVHFHGLRHSSASRMAEAGASDAQVQSITGHKTRAMVEHYTAGAKQKKLAKGAIARLPRKRIKNTSV
jgi:integrase